MELPKMPKKNQSTIIFLIIAVVIILILNLFVMPAIQNASIKQIYYSDFLKMVDNGEVEQADIYEDRIYFKVVTAETGPDGQVCITTPMSSDPGLVDRLYEKGVVFTSVIEQQSFFSVILSWVLPLVIMLVFWVVIMRLMSSRMGEGAGNAMSFGKNTAKIYGEDSTGKTFSDVAGQDEAKESLQEMVHFLKNPGTYTAIGAKLPKGALLVGPPGTGKTLLAKAVAGEAGVPFFSISGSNFVEMFVGVGAARVRDLFKQAMEKAPCIVFIDEIDTIGKSRNSGQYGGNDEREQTLNQLLSEMDGFDSSKGVIILAATNRPEILDPALLRPGRFDRRIIVDMPDLAGREAILKVHAKGVRMGQDVNLNEIAKQTSGVSGADLANIINEGAINAVRQRRNIVTQNDLRFAVDLVIAGAEKKNTTLSEKEKQIVAYHEVGHALVSSKCGNTEPLQKITIIPRTMGALGFTMHSPQEDRYLLLKDEALDRIRVLLGGRSAEEVKFGVVSSGAANDIEKATSLAKNMVTRYGMSDRFDMMGLSTVTNPYLGEDSTMQCSNETATVVDEEVLGIIKVCHDDARKILEENVALMDKLAAVLIEKETLTGEEFNLIVADFEFTKSLPAHESGAHESDAQEDDAQGNIGADNEPVSVPVS